MTGPLVTLDLDGTLLPDDTAFAAILREAGRGAEVAESDERYFSGAQSLEQCFWEQWGWVQELSLADMHRGLRKASWLPDIHAGVRRLHDAGARVAVLTDQPSVVTDFLGRWGLEEAVCSPVAVKEGRCIDIDARFDKWANLQDRLRAWRIDPADVCHVGNGANDVPVWNAVGHSMAVFADSKVREAAQVDLGRPASFLQISDAVQSKML